jgi:hypothetical protein
VSLLFAAPKLEAIMPAYGFTEEQNEIWIKGRDFNKKDGKDSLGVVVRFGEKEATILDVQTVLITVLAPERPDLTADEVVTVQVDNCLKNKTVSAPQSLTFRYIKGKNPFRDTTTKN